MRVLNRFGSAFAPVDGASLAVFRIAFGLIMAIEVWRFFEKDWIHHHYLAPDFLFTYFGFGWVQPWPGEGLYWHFAILGVAALCIAFGAFYRIATVVFFFGFAYVFLLDQARYLNHFYFVLLLGFLMIFLPANRTWAIDAWLRPSLKSQTVPAIAMWTLKAQMEVMLIFAGLVKLNPDWLRLQPLQIWLADRASFPFIGHLFTETWVVAIAAYSAILVHLVGAPLLLWKRTRIYAFAAYCGFHVMNHFMFTIGIFPWLTIAATLIFFDPDWPRQVMRRIPLIGRAAAATVQGAGELKPVGPWLRNAAVVGLAVWIAVQIALPLRHFAYPGRPSWTEEGHRYAWQMMLRRKVGSTIFYVTDPATDRRWTVDNRDFLTPRQIHKMSGNPEMILRYAHHLEDMWRARHGVVDPVVRVIASASLNGRRDAPLIDRGRDLTEENWTFARADWILPLSEPLYLNGKLAWRQE